ncbi:MAG TPA: porin [Gallionellaceae bacterium]|nr:porin [Gallionellaceae bacterium]
MQKNIIALAIAAACAAPVAAMADVSMYGSMDGGVRHQTNDAASAGTTDTMQMGQYNTARFGLKMVEDMGDGLKTNVVLETSLAPGGVGANPNTNSAASQNSQGTANSGNPFGLLFDRQATIGVSGAWGSFDMGWNYTTSFKVIKTYDPFDYKYLAIAGAKKSDLADRAGNMTYAGKFGDVTVMAEYDVNNGDRNQDVGSTTAPGKARALGLTYASGAINAGIAYTAVEAGVSMVTNPANPTWVMSPNDGITHITAGAGYNFGDGKASIGYAKKATKSLNTANSDATDTNMWLGASYNMTAKSAVTAAYYKKTTNSGLVDAFDADSNVLMAGVTYNLSKATQLYAEADKTTVVGTGDATDQITTGVSAGLSTSF